MTETTMEVYAEVDAVLDNMQEEYVNELPKKLRKMFSEKKSDTYVKEIFLDLPIGEQGLKAETLAVLAVLNYNYWCKDEDKKRELIELYNRNEKEYQEKLAQKFSADDMFKKRVDETIQEENIIDNSSSLVAYKESFFTKFINKIKNIFHIN